jgi:alpha-mannosidase
MREAEVALLNAEKYSSLAWLNGADYPADPLNEAWKKVLFNQFHDLAAGSYIRTLNAITTWCSGRRAMPRPARSSH